MSTKDLHLDYIFNSKNEIIWFSSKGQNTWINISPKGRQISTWKDIQSIETNWMKINPIMRYHCNLLEWTKKTKKTWQYRDGYGRLSSRRCGLTHEPDPGSWSLLPILGMYVLPTGPTVGLFQGQNPERVSCGWGHLDTIVMRLHWGLCIKFYDSDQWAQISIYSFCVCPRKALEVSSPTNVEWSASFIQLFLPHLCTGASLRFHLRKSRNCKPNSSESVEQ